MRDVDSLSDAELDTRLRDDIAGRLDAPTPQERATAGADLIRVVQELRRRGRDVAGRERPDHLHTLR